MKDQLSPAEQAILSAWYEYVHNHRPRLYGDDDSQLDSINRQRLFYLMTEIMFEHYNAIDVHWAAYQVCRLMHINSGTLSRWREKWQKVWNNLHYK